MTQPSIPSDRPLTESELQALICRVILRNDSQGRGFIQPQALLLVDYVGRENGLSGDGLRTFVQQNRATASPRKLSEFVNRLISAGIISRSWEQVSSDIYFLSDYGREALKDISTALDFQSAAFVETLQDPELRQRCGDVLQRTRMFDSMVRDAFAVLEDRLKTLPGVRPSSGRRGIAANALAPTTGAYTLGDDDGQKQAAFQLYDGILGFMASPVFHGLQNIEPVRARQIVGFIDTLLHLLTQAQRKQRN